MSRPNLRLLEIRSTEKQKSTDTLIVRAEKIVKEASLMCTSTGGALAPTRPARLRPTGRETQGLCLLSSQEGRFPLPWNSPATTRETRRILQWTFSLEHAPPTPLKGPPLCSPLTQGFAIACLTQLQFSVLE